MEYAPILSIAQDDNYYRVAADFHAIVDALAGAKSDDLPIYIFGDDIYEEHMAYARVGYHSISVNRKGQSLTDIIREKYRGRSPTLHRVSSFLRMRGITFPAEESERRIVLTPDLVKDVCGLPDISILLNQIKNRFVNSRKIRDHAYEDIDEYIQYLMSCPISGPIVMPGQFYDEISYEAILVLWRWRQQIESVPLVLLMEAYALPAGVQSGYERKYVFINDLVATAATALGKEEGVIRRCIPVCKTNVYGASRKLLESGRLSAGTAASLVNTAARLDADDPISVVAAMVPGQQPAPLIFETDDCVIGLRHEPVEEASQRQVAGAARALRNLAGDVLAVGGLENAIPNYRAKIGRIATVLERIQTSDSLDEADLIEFGVEVSAVETRLREAQARLGELSVGEVLSFVVSARSFLSRFPQWTEYQSAPKIELGQNTQENAQIAMELLREFAAMPDVLSAEAKERITEFINHESLDISDPLKREGYAASAENLTAEAAKSIIDNLKEEMGEAASEVRGGLRKAVADAAVTILSRNSSKIYEFATSRGGDWLEMLMNLLRDHHH